jgi:hypothetical protein
VTVYAAAPNPGKLPGTGSLGEMAPSNIRMLALKLAEKGDGWILRAQETAGRNSAVTLRIGAESISVGHLGAWKLGTWRLSRRFGVWQATPTDASESIVREKTPGADSRMVELATLAGASGPGFRRLPQVQ